MHLANNANDPGVSSGGPASGAGGGCTGSAVAMVSASSSLVDTNQHETCRFPKLEECAHFHYERVQLPSIAVSIQPNMERSLHSQHSQDEDSEWHMVQVTSGDECWLLQRTFENFRLLDSQLHQCIYDRKISQLPDLSQDHSYGSSQSINSVVATTVSDAESLLVKYLRRFTTIADNSINCGPVLNWLQMDNKGHRLLVPSEESRSINTPAVAAAYSVRRYVSQARDELNLEVGDMISVIDMASPGESIWWRGKRGFQVGFFPQHCVHIIGDKVPRNIPLPAPVVGSLALSPIKPVLRKHGKLIAFFRSFILNRPSRRRLKQSGILRERVFGCDLGEHLLNSGCDIPTVLKCCAEFIETHGIVDGIYRLSGVTSNIQKLRNAFDEDRIPNLYTEDILQDIHSVASLLKMYFRELPNPLCTYQLYQSFVQAVQGCTSSMRSTHNDHERLLKMREAVQKLPPPHYRTLEYLARHLARVAKHGDHTGMTVRNVAIVWAPNLLRSEELEVGGVAALQGVGVQAVVTEFLICYADLIFCDNLNAKLNVSDLDAAMQQAAMLNAASPKRSRPKSLAISTPTKLITLEEARNKHHKDTYIEVGGGPDSLPKKYHTIIDLPMRKRVNSKRSPLGWRSLFGKGRNRSQKPTIVHHVVNTEQVDAGNSNTKPEVKIVLRTVKSAESLSDLDQLPPLQNVLCTKPPGHNRSVSHDSYFDTLQSSQEGSLLDLSEIQVNFDLEESEMRIFSEDESLVSSPRVQPRRIRISSGNVSGNPSPKKQPRVILSPDSASRKRTRLEEQLSDIQFIDCNTPEMICGSTIAQVHHQVRVEEGPRNKSPRNSQCLELCDYTKRDSSRYNADKDNRISQIMLTSTSTVTTGTPQSPTPQSPTYKLLESSTGTTPGDISPHYLSNLSKAIALSPVTSVACTPLTPTPNSPKSPNYDNVLTTISITYKSPTKTKSFMTDERVTGLIPESPNYEVVTVKAEDAQIPTSTANLPLQAAKTLIDDEMDPRSLNMDFRTSTASMTNMSNSMSTINDIHEELQKEVDTEGHLISDSNVHLLSPSLDLESKTENRSSLNLNLNEDDDSFPKCDTTLSELIDSYDRIAKATSGDWSHVETDDLITDIDTQETSVLPDSARHYENVKSSNSSDDTSNCLLNYETINFNSNGDEGMSPPNGECSLEARHDDLIEFSPVADGEGFEEIVSKEVVDLVGQLQEKRKQSSQVSDEQDQDVYQQVKYFRRSVHELNEFIALTHDPEVVKGVSLYHSEGGSNLEVSYENVNVLNQTGTTEDDDNEDVAKVIEIIEPETSVEVVDTMTEDEHHGEVQNLKSLEEESVVMKLPTHCIEQETYDSLETNPYEPIEFTTDSLEADIGVNQEEVITIQPKTDVIELKESEHLNNVDIAMTTSLKDDVSMSVAVTTVDDPGPPAHSSRNMSESEAVEDIAKLTNTCKVKQLTSKFEVPDAPRALPPCIRARNLKASKKTARSLDETEFLKQVVPQSAAMPNVDSSGVGVETNGAQSIQEVRRKSLDENMCGFKTNTLPKTLNKPKTLPDDPEIGQHVVQHDIPQDLHVNLNRERIEKYKEERRKFLHDKYRSESFKENKDVLLSRLKVFKPPTKEEEGIVNCVNPVAVVVAPPEAGGFVGNAALETVTPVERKLIASTNGANGVKARTAIFEAEPEVEMRPGCVSSRRGKVTAPPLSGGGGNDREREKETESAFQQARRSFEPAPIRKDRSSTSYCIKDMKAIFESKSNQ